MVSFLSKSQSFTIFTGTIMHLVYPPNLHNNCFQFLQGVTVAPRKIEDGAYAKFWGVNKVQYGLGENS